MLMCHVLMHADFYLKDVHGNAWRSRKGSHGPAVGTEDSTVESRPLAVTTVLTVLSRLEKKGLVERERSSRPHRYRAVTSREDHTAELMLEVLGSAPDREAVLARFIGTVSAGEAETLRKLLGH